MRHIGDWLTTPLIVLILWLAFLWKGYECFRIQPPTSVSAKSVPISCLSASQKGALPHGTATRALPINWRVSANDVEGLPVANNLYISCALTKGDPVIVQDLQSAPKIAPDNGKVTYSFPLQSNSVVDNSLNAGMQVEIFPEKGLALVTSVHVLATVCDDGCVAIIEMTPTESQLLAMEPATKLRVVARQ